MKFENLTVRTFNQHGDSVGVQTYVNGTINFRVSGFVYVYWGEGTGVDVYSGNYCFEIKPSEVKK